MHCKTTPQQSDTFGKHRESWCRAASQAQIIEALLSMMGRMVMMQARRPLNIMAVDAYVGCSIKGTGMHRVGDVRAAPVFQASEQLVELIAKAAIVLRGAGFGSWTAQQLEEAAVCCCPESQPSR